MVVMGVVGHLKDYWSMYDKGEYWSPPYWDRQFAETEEERYDRQKAARIKKRLKDKSAYISDKESTK